MRLQLLHTLVAELYAWPGCLVGGPFHVLLDDGNFEDANLDASAQNLAQPQWKGIKELGTAILEMLRTLSPAQRCYWWDYRSTDEVLSVAGKRAEWDNENQDWVVKE